MEPSIEEIGGGPQPGPEVSPLLDRSDPRPASDELRASLAAVEAAREAARRRLRRDTRRVRLLTLAVLGMTSAAAFGLVNRARASRRAVEAARAAAVEAAAVPVTPPATAPAAAPAAEAIAAAAPEPALAPPAAAPEAGPPDDRAAPIDPDSARAECREAYAAHRWRTAIDACGRAFEALPTEAALAMKVAQAQHARGRYAAAGEWAHRALAAGGADPEAFVIVAHAERRARHPAEARSAYRQYLALAPRGWHASEARAAVRSSRASTTTAE